MAFWSKHTKEKDVVCGMHLDPQAAGASLEYEGRTYYFCSSTCKASFGKEPQKYTQVPQQHSGGMEKGCH